MRIKFPYILPIIAALAATASVGFAAELDLWFTPLSSEGPMKAPLTKWLKESLPKELPGVTVADNYGPPIYQDGQQKFVVQGRKGKPDVIESVLEGMIAYQRAGLLAPIDDLFDKWPDKDQFIPSTIKALTLNGKLYGVPYNTNVRVLLYRKDLFEKYGLTPPKTWDDFLQDAATISSKESGVAGLGLTTKNGSVRTFQEFISFFFEVNNGENPYKYDEAGKKWVMNTTPEKLAQVLKLYTDFFFAATPSAANQNTRGNDYQATDTDYVSGKSAMVPMGPWIYSYRTSGDVAKKILEEETGVTPLPLPPGGVQATYLEVKPISINAFSKDKKDAWNLVKILTSKEFVATANRIEGVNPPRKDVAELPDFKNDWWEQAFIAQLPTGVALAPINWGLVINDITEALQKAIYKNATPEDAGKELYNTLEQRAKDNQL
ncbi:MAG TPA: sugar ABC transporter substrate-binding protein [Chthoniobacterales bacterium]|jgi:ABC-type glycerol-3-phosphate transport system substrate-binding protein|nr:sugar ABC transporter substrate-binding protein [Chthoniobacterales bacterium]